MSLRKTTGSLLALALAIQLTGCQSSAERPGGGSGGVAPDAGEPAPPSLETLSENEMLEGFRTVALYLDDGDRVMGGRFRHERTGFLLDLLQIESAPQAFIWVNTLPVSDRGEPHTQEHLLLGKGNVGRYVASLEDMSLVSSSAFTGRIRTAYHLHTTAGTEVFWSVLERRLEALLSPDYTDEEIRREVHHFGVTVEPDDGSLRLEEGGTVYNEMVTSFERPAYRLWLALCRHLYGPGHPLALSSGGLPEAIREMTPEHIRGFHATNYQLGNMGMIAALSSDLEAAVVLRRIDEILGRLQPEPTDPDQTFLTEDELPPPSPGATPEEMGVSFVDYPSRDGQGPVELTLAWPPTLDLSREEQLLMSLFLRTLAGDANTNLYKRFVDSATREIDVGATSVYGDYLDWPGLPIFVGLEGIPSSRMDEATALDIRRRVMVELAGIAGWEPGAPELVDFNRRVRSQLVSSQRAIRDFVGSPPRFGYRGTSGQWLDHLRFINRSESFRRSLTRKGEAAFIDRLLSDDGQNPWADRLHQWGLLGRQPYLLVTRPSAALQQELQASRESRLAAELEALEAAYDTEDASEALRHFQTEYDTRTEALERLAAEVPLPPFLEHPPLTVDDALDYRVETWSDTRIPVVTSSFQSMSGATVGLALRLDGLERDDYVYLSLLPELMRRVGVIEDGRPVAFDEMVERIQNEILDLRTYVSADFNTDRAELVVRGGGTTEEEARTALAWMALVLYHADWRPENLPRIRDVVAETLDTLRRTTQHSEESWVNDPANAYRRQDNPLLLATQSFLTRTHHAMRLRWLLSEAPDAETEAAMEAFLGGLAEAGESGDRETVTSLLAALRERMGSASGSTAEDGWSATLEALGEAGRPLALQAIDDLELTLPGVPDETLAADWSYLCRQMAADLAVPPADALARLDDLRRRLLVRPRARLFSASSGRVWEALGDDVSALVEPLAPADGLPEGPDLTGFHLVWDNLRDHRQAAEPPLFVGLVNPDTQGGVFLNSAPTATYADTDRESLLRFLSGRMYGGGGAHSMFMKTWSAGLAYSNGLRADPRRGRLRYYAERCPELPQTLRFVIDQLRAVASDPGLADYALAQGFSSRSAARYEERAEAMAEDLADGRTPERVRAFRQAMLALRSDPGLSGELFARMESVYGRVLPGYGPPSASVEGAVYFVIGPERQLALYETYLQSAEGPDTTLQRLYPRDYWMRGPTAER